MKRLNLSVKVFVGVALMLATLAGAPARLAKAAPASCQLTWTWTTVGPEGHFLSDVQAFSATDVWAVGDIILHYDGTAWNEVPHPAGDLQAIHGATADDVWAVGSIPTGGGNTALAIQHWDGTNWSSVPGPALADPNVSLSDVLALAHDNVWAVGGKGEVSRLILHWDGGAWAGVPGPSGSELTALAATGANDVWAVGAGVLHWNGISWSTTRPDRATAIVALATDEVWISVSDPRTGEAYSHWNGKGWEMFPNPSVVAGHVNELAAVASDDIYASTHNIYTQGIQHWDGTSWNLDNTYMMRDLNITGLSMVSASEGWGAGGWLENYYSWTPILHAVLVHGGPPCVVAPPAVPQLVKPRDGATKSGPAVTLKWTPGEDIWHYELQLFKDRPKGAHRTIVTPSNGYKLVNPAPGRTYYWRVRACRNFCGEWSLKWRVRVLKGTNE